MRAAMEVAKLISQFDSKVELIKDNLRVEGNDILQILSLGAMQDEHVTAEAFGNQAEETLQALQALFESDFGRADD